MIPYFRLAPNKEELQALTHVHSTGNWIMSDAISEVKTKLKSLFNKEQIVLTSNGYSALFISIKSLGLVNEKIIVPCISTCFAITNAIIATGNIPIFSDVNSNDGNCSIESVTALIKMHDVKCIISPNYAGNISNISYFKNELKLIVIEDACQSFFSSLECKSEADIQVFSFYPTKGMNGIDGGAILTNNKKIADKATDFVYYGDQTEYMITEHYNFRFLNINATVLLANLNKITSITDKLQNVKQSYDKVFEQKSHVKVLSNQVSKILQRYVICFQNIALKEAMLKEFKKQEIAIPSFFIRTSNETGKYELAEYLLTNCFCIPYFENLTKEEINKIIETIENVFAKG